MGNAVMANDDKKNKNMNSDENKTPPCYDVDKMKQQVYNRLYKYYLEQEQIIYNKTFDGKYINGDKDRPYPTCKRHSALFAEMNDLLNKTRNYVSDSQSWPEIFMF